MSYWVSDPTDETAHYLVLRHPNGWYEARIKYDGCFELVRAHNDPLPELPEPTAQLIDQIHVCDVDELIAQLQELKQIAFAKFGSEFWSVHDTS